MEELEEGLEKVFSFPIDKDSRYVLVLETEYPIDSDTQKEFLRVLKLWWEGEEKFFPINTSRDVRVKFIKVGE